MWKKLTLDEKNFGDNRKVINRNNLDGFIQKAFSTLIHADIKEIVKQCFSAGADMVHIFLNKTDGTFYCSSFMPISFKKTGKIPSSCGKIEIGCRIVALPWCYPKTGCDIPEGAMAGIVDNAKTIGYWNGDYAFGVLNEDGELE
jgi:hypothetical protein